MEAYIQNEIFDILKRALKAKSITYVELAARIKVSEPTIKRMFAERDCKFSRLMAICRVLGISATELLESATRADDVAETLPQSAEKAFAASPSLFHFFILLRDSVPVSQILDHYDLSEADIFLYGRDLEKLGLAEITNSGKIALASRAPVRFALGSPLHSVYRKINLDFVVQALENSDHDEAEGEETFLTLSLRMLPASSRQLREEMYAIIRKVGKRARQDLLIARNDDLETFRWSFVTGPASFSRMLTIRPHRDNRKSSVDD
ncbi:MAG: helix-turn-helix transcriptional regulator [Cohaesibacteraceae bacterium]|nr:helix-turn-helix transcriptional regulator [Cohaesibacteraceae bacterium]